MAATAAIELKGLGKVYDGTVALAQVDHAFEAGRVHALMGNNGSGKSTLVKILAGAVRPTLGEVVVKGARAAFDSPRDAFAAGIITVHQELSLVPSLSVGENIYLGRLPHAGASAPLVDWEGGSPRAPPALLARDGARNRHRTHWPGRSASASSRSSRSSRRCPSTRRYSCSTSRLLRWRRERSSSFSR